jgi:hypothetical protein
MIPLAGKIANLYTWALGLGGLAALGVLIFGAILYITSAGNASRQEEAKEWMKGSLIGLMILFGSFFILNTINPGLTQLKDIALEQNKPPESSSGKPLSPTSTNPISVPLLAFPFGEGIALREVGIPCNDYGACGVHTEGCALLNESGGFCSNNIVGSGNCGTKINSTLVNNLLAAREAGFNINVLSSVCSDRHGKASFHYRLLAVDLNLPSSDEEIRGLMTFLSSTPCIHDLWGPSRFSGLCVDNGSKGVPCSVPNHENHLHYDVYPNCK